jgi:hypothetical protein
MPYLVCICYMHILPSLLPPSVLGVHTAPGDGGH